MPLLEAIRSLNDVFGHICEGTTLNQDKAILLGIEALKRIKDSRHGMSQIFQSFLPGETEDQHEH